MFEKLNGKSSWAVICLVFEVLLFNEAYGGHFAHIDLNSVVLR